MMGGGRRLHNRIVSSANEWVAAQHACAGFQAATNHSVALDRFHGVLGTGGHVAARWGKHRRDRPLVGSEQLQNREFGELAQIQASLRDAVLFLLLVSGAGSAGLLSDAPTGRLEPLSLLAAGCVVTFCSTTVSARRTSSHTVSKSVVSNDFLGLMTTSTFNFVGGCERRTASRRRRFIRLRCTAPPRARPTVNPTRRPALASGRNVSGLGM
jgi:hypothetical protein